MPNRIEVASKIFDTRAQARQKTLAGLGFSRKIKQVCLVDVYTISKRLTQKQLRVVAVMLANPVTQIATVNQAAQTPRFSWAVEIGFLPGVTDNVGATAKEAIEDLLKIKFRRDEGVYCSQLMLISGRLSQNDALLLADNLANPLTQRVHLKNYRQFQADKGMDRIVPEVKLTSQPRVQKVNLQVSDKELIKLGKEGIANQDGSRRGPLALDLIYLKTIRKYFCKLGRQPTDIELESLAQTWSEHCKHTIFADPLDEVKNGLFRTYIQGATEKVRKKIGKRDFCVSVFTDNSGAIEFDKDYLITHKVETHNSPSALDPFGGAITGIVGVNRDALGFGLGAKPIGNTYGFCLADPKGKVDLYRDQDKKHKMLSARRIMEGVVAGVNAGGNCSGIPTPQGFVYFDERYRGKPLVFVGTIGLIPKKIRGRKAYLKKARPGDYIVMAGGRVGKDGIHGATFSSEALSSGSPAGAVQIGDPITQKKLSDALVKEARALKLYHSLTDNGAGGLSCSVAEMAKESGGFRVQLEKVPLKYPGLSPWEIWVSESQERMTLAVPKNKWPRFSELMQHRGVEATIIGRFTNSGRCQVTYHRKKIMDLAMTFLHHGLPPRPMSTSFAPSPYQEPSFSQPKDLTLVFLKMLSRLNHASFTFISQQYDCEVQGTSVLKPLQGRGRINAETTVVRPLLHSTKALVISQGLYPSYSEIDPYRMAACSLDTAVRNAVAAGANPSKLALLDNFCWCSSDQPARLWQLKRAVKACYDYAILYQTPFISGKDSMFNDFKGFTENGQTVKISVLPTLLISSLGVVDNALDTLSLDAKFPQDLVYLLGETREELGGSEYYAMNGFIGKRVPQVRAASNRKLYQAFFRCTQKNLIASSISVGRGGLALALAKTAMGGLLGLSISLKNLVGEASRDDWALFSESQGRILVTVNPKKRKVFEQTLKSNLLTCLGQVTADGRLKVKGRHGRYILKSDVGLAWRRYQSTFKDY